VKKYFTFIAFFIFSASIYAAECEDKVFSNLSASKGTTISQMLEQLSSRCSFSIAVKDDGAEAMLDKSLNTINLRDFTLRDIFDFLLVDNKLDYEYQNGILRISSYTSKTFKVDYVASKRTSSGTSGTQTGSTPQQSTTTSTSMSAGSSSSGINIASEDNFDFWDKIESEVYAVLNQTSSKTDSNTTDTNKTLPTQRNGVIVNKVAGLITVTSSKENIERVAKYLASVIERLHQQVLIDVQLLSVSLSNSQTTGIDWSQIYSLQNVDLRYGSNSMRNIDTITFPTTGSTSIAPTITGARSGGFGWDYLTFDGKIQISEIIKFLKTQGNVKSISNPKLLTLNNQAALINSGNQIFYKRSGSVVSGGTTSTTTASEIIESVFSGISLDITPEILDDENIILKINPSITECVSPAQCQASTSKIPDIKSQPPDLAKKQISSVVKAHNGSKIILGGLIRNSTDNTNTKVPLFGDIPLLGYAFGQEAKKETIDELVIIITPYIVKKDKVLSLKELGYKNDFDK
jgi:general secretion pathway protein D